MVLYNTLDEELNAALLYGDAGKYIEERALLLQLSLVIGEDEHINGLDEYFVSQVKGNSKDLSEKDKNIINDRLWKFVYDKLDGLLPDESFKDFVNAFESKIPNMGPNHRISTIQNLLITYFIEKLKIDSMDESITEEQAQEKIGMFKESLIGPNSAYLDDASVNLSLDESIIFFDTKLGEYYDLIREINVK